MSEWVVQVAWAAEIPVDKRDAVLDALPKHVTVASYVGWTTLTCVVQGAAIASDALNPALWDTRVTRDVLGWGGPDAIEIHRTKAGGEA